MDIIFKKSEEVSYPLEETDQYEDQSQDILNSIILKKNCQWLRGVDRELQQMRFCYWNKGDVKQWCKTVWFKSTST